MLKWLLIQDMPKNMISGKTKSLNLELKHKNKLFYSYIIIKIDFINLNSKKILSLELFLAVKSTIF